MKPDLPPPATALPLLYVDPADQRCTAAAAFLEEHGVGHRRLDVRDNPSLASEAERKAGRPGLPVLDWNGHVLAAFDDDQLAAFLHTHNVKLEDS